MSKLSETLDIKKHPLTQTYLNFLTTLIFIIIAIIGWITTKKSSKFSYNSYALYILAGGILKFIPEKLIKSYGYNKLKNIDENTYSLWKLWKRPIDDGSGKYEGGMPSGHSWSIAYIVTLYILNIREKYYSNKNIKEDILDITDLFDPDSSKNVKSNSLKMNKRLSIILVAKLITYAVLIGLSRVDGGYHTYLQVVVGMICGVIWGYLWFIIDKNFLRNNPDYMADREAFLSLVV